MLVTEDCKMKNCANISSTEKPLLAVHWLETHAIAGFRVWQLMFLSFAALLALVIILCCCIRYRIPRTKQEIEADYIRKKITKKFQKQLRTIQNSDMDEMDLKRALDRIRAEFKSDTESLAQSEALSEATLSSGNYGSQPGNSDSKKDGLGKTYSSSYTCKSLALTCTCPVCVPVIKHKQQTFVNKTTPIQRIRTLVLCIIFKTATLNTLTWKNVNGGTRSTPTADNPIQFS
ncbi:hypothetical protein RUM44_010378 [Polyplax serrata]|uniref:Transmembrane inner ear expressed protein n=1 Tax=Polyplax serrata TaxID=468196 RepID=A0ABR1AVD1_POLSC